MLVPGKPAVIWNTSGGSSGASGKTRVFLCLSNDSAHARLRRGSGCGRLEKYRGSKVVPGQMAPLDLLRNRISQKHLFSTVFDRLLGNPVPESFPSDPLPYITRRDLKETLATLCFPKGFRHAPWQRTGVRVARWGPRLAPLDLLRSGISQKRLFFQCF